MASCSAREIQPRAQDALAASPVVALRDLKVVLTDDVLLIRGAVTSFYHKQLAQEAVRAVAEGVAVVNAIDVQQ